MSEPTSSHSNLARRKRPRWTLTRPMFPEGLLTPALLIALVTIAGYCVQTSDWTRIVVPVSVMAFLAALFGSLIARLRVLDSVAHMVSIGLGIGLAFSLVASRADDLEGGLRERGAEIGTVGLRWYLGQRVDDEMEALLVSLMMGIILWLVGYLAAWSLFRRGWILATVFPPGFLILVNLGYAEAPQTEYLAAFSLVALVLIARHNLYCRQLEWGRNRMRGSAGVTRGFLLSGIVVAVVATSAGWWAPATLSQDALQPLVGEVSTSVLNAQDYASQWLRDLGGESSLRSQTSGSYASFGDSFAVGGPLELTDQPQVLVFADNAPYLTAQHYDSYSGRGWFSTTEDTFNPVGDKGQRYSPEMTFAVNQPAPLTSQVTQARTSSAIEITPLAPMDDRVLTADTYLSANVETSVRMSWIQLDGVEYDIGGEDVSGLPRDLQSIAVLLHGAELTGEVQDGSPVSSNAELQAQIELERDQLRGRFLEVSWTADEAGRVQTLIVSGQAPVYDDVEAVFSDDSAISGDTYRVVGLRSTATPDDLMEAGEDYPEWVTDRYLSLPDSITLRTTELTRAITTDSGNPYEQARAIEQFLRTEIAYDENVNAPPDDADIVDYLLFERQRGYCEYSASAMTVMLRTLGVPARVAVGFYPGDYDQSRAGYLYLQANAHAWTEVYFPGYGWIPFEPTSSQPLIEEGVNAGADLPDTEPTGLAVEETPTPAPSSPLATPGGGQTPASITPPQVTPEGGGGMPRWLLAMGAGGLLLDAALVAGWLFWSVPLRGLAPSSSLYTRLRRIGTWLGVAPAATATPQEYGRAFAVRVPQARNHVERIVKTYEVDQFGPDRAGSGWLGAAEEAWSALKRQLPRWLIRWRR